MSKKDWNPNSERYGKYLPVIILTKDNILDWVGDSWMGSRSFGNLDSKLKQGLDQEGMCWLIRNPSMSKCVRVGKAAIKKGLKLEIFETHRKDRIFYLVDEMKARAAVKGLAN